MTERRRMLLLFSVLAGLFLMHGLSAGGPGGCHGASPNAMPMRMPVATASMQAHSRAYTNPDFPVAAGVSAPVPEHAMIGESCVPLRPEGLSGFFLALFVIVIALWRPWLPRIARSIRCYWPHGPPRTGVQILHTLSISRT